MYSILYILRGERPLDHCKYHRPGAHHPRLGDRPTSECRYVRCPRSQDSSHTRTAVRPPPATIIHPANAAPHTCQIMRSSIRTRSHHPHSRSDATHAAARSDQPDILMDAEQQTISRSADLAHAHFSSCAGAFLVLCSLIFRLAQARFWSCARSFFVLRKLDFSG